MLVFHSPSLKPPKPKAHSLCFALDFLVSLLAAVAMATPPPPTAPQIIIETPPTPLQLETQTPPPQSNPPFLPHPPFPVAVVSAPQSPPLPSTESLATAPLTFGVIQAYYRRVRRFLGMEVVRAIIGLGVGALLTYLWMKNKK